eukprot:15436513-Alexandrium_andersonii.AAC.1
MFRIRFNRCESLCVRESLQVSASPRRGAARRGTARRGAVRCGAARCGAARCIAARCGTEWCVVRRGAARPPLD